MKNTLLFTVIILSTLSVQSQLNMTQVGQLDLTQNHPNVELNDVWGYTDEVGNEYAIVGTSDGTAIVDISTPSNPVEIFWEPGLNSTWRDIKVNGDYAYVTTEAEAGLLIIDMTPLPGSSNLTTAYYYGTPSTNEWESAHNIWIDSNDRAYIFGANGSNEGTIILDISSPMNPVEIGGYDNWYAHDGYVRNDTGYFAHIEDGFFSMVDVSDPMNPVVLGTNVTPNSLSHNIWPNDQGSVAFTTDEVSAGYIAAYDISNPSSIQQLDKIQSSPGAGIIPHNTQYLNGYLVTSYYTDGIVIHDASSPSNLVEVANYDTTPLSSPDFFGSWGVFPYFSSGLIVASDIEEGLFVLDPTYKDAAYVHGTVTDASNSDPIFQADAEIINDPNFDKTDASGAYQVGTVDQSTVDIAFFKVGYYRDTLFNVALTPGDTTISDIALTPIPQFGYTINVYDQNTMQPLPNIKYKLKHPYIDYSGTTNGNGKAQLNLYYEDIYELSVAQWGYGAYCDTNLTISTTNNSVDVYIDKGYYDDFTFDLGWSSFGNATEGLWERGVPIASGNTFLENPDGDVPGDCGEQAYVTGLADDNVMNGSTTLISPVFDATGYNDPYVGFKHFYFNFWATPPDDTLKVSLSNGTETELIYRAYYSKPGVPMSEWIDHEFRITDYLAPSANMQLILTISDIDQQTVNITEAAIDEFRIIEGSGVGLEKQESEDFKIYPNPAVERLYIETTTAAPKKYQIISAEGQFVRSGSAGQSYINVADFASGFYIINIQKDDGSWEKHSFIKE